MSEQEVTHYTEEELQNAVDHLKALSELCDSMIQTSGPSGVGVIIITCFPVSDPEDGQVMAQNIYHSSLPVDVTKVVLGGLLQSLEDEDGEIGDEQP